MARGKTGSLSLKLAAAYNLIWGALIILFPNLLFDLSGLDRPTYPQIWQCVGMIVGVYGVGYYIASFDPVRHWPIVLVGFMGKIFGPIGFAVALYEGVFNIKFGSTIIFNDLIWWIPFAVILWSAMKENSDMKSDENIRSLDDLKFDSGESFVEKSKAQPLLFVLVRHRGCTFCREALDELSKNMKKITDKGYKPYVVHMGSSESGNLMKDEYSLDQVEFISDPNKNIYRLFGARRGTLKELFGPRVWARGVVAGMLKKHGVGKLEGDGFQLGGVYLLEDGKLRHVHDPCDAADVEDWNKLLAHQLA